MARRTWVWPIAVLFASISIVYWGYRMLFGGGIDGGFEMFYLISSAVTSTLLLWLGWQLRRSTPA